MTKPGSIPRNIVSNWSGFAVNTLFTLLMTPLIIRQLGDANYGVWVLITSFTGYYGLLDLGFRSGVTQYLTRYTAVGDYDRVNIAASSALAMLSVAAVIVELVSIGIAFACPYLFRLPQAAVTDVFWAVIVVGLVCSMQFVFFPFSSVFTATQRFDTSNLIGITTRVLTAGAVYFAIARGGGLVALTIATGIGNVVDYALRWRISYHLMPQLRISMKAVEKKTCREMSSFGAWNFLTSVSSSIGVQAHALIVGSLLPMAAVAHYALAANLGRQLTDIFKPIGQVYYPVGASLHARGDTKGLQNVYLTGTRFLLLVAVVAAVIAGVFAEDFYRLWVGPKYISGTVYPSVALLLRILLVSIVAGYVSNISSQLMVGSGQVRASALITASEAVVRLLLSIILIKRFGLLGMAYAGCISSLGLGFGLPFWMGRQLAVPFWRFLVAACLRPAVAGGILAAALFGIRGIHTAATMRELMLQGAASSIVAGVVIAALGFSGEQRQRFLWDPLLRRLGVAVPAISAARAGGD
jgi:O-antigen/teichoic acid export membrane protein